MIGKRIAHIRMHCYYVNFRLDLNLKEFQNLIGLKDSWKDCCFIQNQVLSFVYHHFVYYELQGDQEDSLVPNFISLLLIQQFLLHVTSFLQPWPNFIAVLALLEWDQVRKTSSVCLRSHLMAMGLELNSRPQVSRMVYSYLVASKGVFYQLLSLFPFPRASTLHSDWDLNQDLAELDFLRLQDSTSFLAVA